MKCANCGKGSASLHRVNPVGEEGIFWCKACLGREPESDSKGEPMSVERQLELWVQGRSVHNSERDECCPDFSCCKPHLLWPRAKRIRFSEAFVDEDDEVCHEMLMDALVELAGDAARVMGESEMVMPVQCPFCKGIVEFEDTMPFEIDEYGEIHICCDECYKKRNPDDFDSGN